MAGKRLGPGVPTGTNRVHFACFVCRKTFKQPGSSNWDSNVPDRPFPCPECKQPMARMGRHFKAPRQRAVRAWQEVERLYLAGERFD
jgi:hypothetical protein